MSLKAAMPRIIHVHVETQSDQFSSSSIVVLIVHQHLHHVPLPRQHLQSLIALPRSLVNGVSTLQKICTKFARCQQVEESVGLPQPSVEQSTLRSPSLHITVAPMALSVHGATWIQYNCSLTSLLTACKRHTICKRAEIPTPLKGQSPHCNAAKVCAPIGGTLFGVRT